MLSLDVAAGAVIGAAFFARILGVDLLVQGLVVLGLTVWLIYTADHLLDAYLMKHPASSARHKLHQHYFRPLLVALIIVGVVDIVVAFYIRRQLIEPGIIFGAACGVYLLLNRWLRYMKEIVAAVLYTGGVLLPSWSLAGSVSFDQVIVVVQFVMIVLANMFCFAWLSYEEDLRDEQQSMVTLFGVAVTRRLLAATFVILGIFFFVPISAEYTYTRLVLAPMGLVMLSIFLFPRYFGKEDRFRVVGDAVFLIPLTVLV